MLEHQERITVFGRKIPHYFWFMLSGALCDVAQAFIDYFVYLLYAFEWERATVWYFTASWIPSSYMTYSGSWAVSYTLSIVIRHSSHRFIGTKCGCKRISSLCVVFGEYEGTYCSSLMMTYFSYSSSIVLSILTNHILVEIFHMSHQHAWIITMLWTGIYNYFMLKMNWRRAIPSVWLT